MGLGGVLSFANLAAGQVVVIDINGKIRILNPGEQALPGELVIQLPQQLPQAAADDILAQQVSPDGQIIDVSEQITEIISAIEQGQDPTQVDPELAPAAGGLEGSSLGLSGSVARDALETIAQTQFITQGGTPLILSRTQSQGLEDFIFRTVSTDSIAPVDPLEPTEPTEPVEEVSNPPIALDDPIGFSLTQGNMSEGTTVNVGWDDVTLSSQFNGLAAEVGILDDGRVGVTNGAPAQGPSEQLQYDRESGQSEKLSITFPHPVTEGRFAVTNLYTNEGKGAENHEVGTWIAYLNGVAVTSGVIDASNRGSKAFVDIETGGFAFDEVVFQANEYGNGLVGDTENDSSDFYIAGIEVSSATTYATNQNEELRISISEVLANDSDIDGDTLSITLVNVDASIGQVRIEGNEIVFVPNGNHSGPTQLEYQITDGNGGFANANINVIVNPAPTDALVEGVFLRNAQGGEQEGIEVSESETFIYTTVLNKPTLGLTFYDFFFSGTAGSGDVTFGQDYSALVFTNGVTVREDPDNPGSYQFVVPDGVKEFDTYVTTVLDGVDESVEALILTVGSESDTGDTVDASATGTILNNTAPEIKENAFAYELVQGDVTLDGTGHSRPNFESESKWQDVTLNAQFGGQSSNANIEDGTGLVGIDDGANTAGPAGQIQYDRETGMSETLSIKLGSPATSGTFTISRLFENEGAGLNNHEAGTWVAYLNGVAVASGSFDGEGLGRGNRGTFEIDTDGYAFDEIVFAATEYSQGIQGDHMNDSSDYYLAGIEVKAEDSFNIVRGTTLRISTALLLENVSDREGDQLRIGDISVPYEAGKVKIVDGYIEFYSRTSYKGETTITFEVVDEHGAISVGEIPVNLAGAPSEAVIASMALSPSYVDGDDDFPVTVSLDKVALETMQYDFKLSQLDGGAELPIDAMADLSFTNGVKVIGDNPMVIEVPVGVGEFELYIDGDKVAVDGGINIAIGEASLHRIPSDAEATKYDDVVIGTDVGDILNGSEGNDILIGLLGDDVLTGGKGEDIFKWLEFDTNMAHEDTVTDFEIGKDKLDISDLIAHDDTMESILSNIVVENGAQLNINFSDGSTQSLNIALDNSSGQFDSITQGVVAGDNLKNLVDTMFVNLPE